MRWYLAFFVMGIVASYPARAQVSAGGGVIISIEDQTTHPCINVTNSLVSIQLSALQVKRTNSWWSKSKTLGGKFDVTIADQTGKSVSFPRGSQLSARDITGDLALLPTQFSVMSKYDLAPASPYSSVDLQFSVINIEDESPVAKALTSFIDMTKTLPLPAGLVGMQGVQLFSDLVKKTITDNLQTVADRTPVAEFEFDLASSDDDVKRCPPMALKEGAYAVIFQDPGSETDGVVSITDQRDYCFWIDPSNSTMLFSRRSSGICSDPKTAKRVMNPLVTFIVSKWSKPGSGTTAGQALMYVPTSSSPTEKKPASWSISTTEITDSNIRRTLDTLANKDRRYQSLNLDPNTVQSFLNTITGAESPDPKLLESNDPSRVAEAEVAAHLHLCAVAGIPVRDCD